MRPACRKGFLAIAACLACGLLAAPAQASFHLMSVREVFPGSSTAGANAEYVELQMYASGQNFVNSHEVRFYPASGGPVFGPNFTANVPNGANQQTILVATAAAEASFGINADLAISNGDRLDPAGGAACWENLDCVSWGNFTGEASLGSPSGTPATAIPDGSALRRSIAPGCPTLLEAGDDTDNSATDFALTSPQPRNNSSPLTETSCGGGGGSDNNAPQTKLKKRPKNRSHDRTPTFKFKSDESGSTFKCKLDRKPFKKCKSPKTLHVHPGTHKFKVEAIDSDGNVDKSPAKDKFTVLP